MLQHKNSCLLIAFILLSVIACSPTKSIKEQLSDAQQLIEEGNTTHAVIALKNILKDAPTTASARFLLSQQHFKTGNVEAAEKELKKSIEYGLDVHKYGLTLAEMYIEMNDSHSAVELLEGMDLADDSDNIIKSILSGRAYINLGNIERAKEAFELANDINEESSFSLYGSAIVASIGSEYDKAAELLDKSIDINKNIAEVWLLRARIAEANKNYDKAVSAYQSFMQLRPQAYSIELLLAENYIRLGKLDQADEIVDKILAINSYHPTSNLLKARIAGQRKDFTAVKLYSELALSVLPSNPLALYLSGVANFYLNNYEQSYSKLIKVVDQLPKSHQAHKLFMMNLLKLGYLEQLNKTMSDYTDFDANDLNLLGSIGDNLFYQGDIDEAAKVFEKIVKLAPNANDDKTKLAVLKLLNKDLAGIDELEEISSGEESNRNASFALALTYYQKQDYTLAMKTINAWLVKDSDDIEALLFRANIFEAQGLVQNSFITLKSALEQSSENNDALFMLAQNRLKASDVTAAQSHLEHLIDINPQYKRAYTLLLRIKRSQNKEDEFFQLMTAIIQNDNNEYSWPRVILAQKALLENKFDYAEGLLAGLSNDNLSDAYFSTMMDIYFGKKNITKINLYVQMWKKKSPNNVLPYLKHISLIEKSGNIEKALTITKSSLAEPELKNNMRLQVLQAGFLLRLNMISEAGVVIKSLQSSVPENSIVLLLSGQFELMQGNLPEALELLNSSYEQTKTSKSLLLLVDAYRKSNTENKAISLIENANKEIFEQVSVQTILAEIYINTDVIKAINVYEKLVVSSPNNVMLLNNLAWLLIQEDRFVPAVKYAKMAERLMPKHGAILDTLGVALLGVNEDKEALSVLTRANSVSSETSIKIHLAIAMHKNNQQKEALNLLGKLTEKEVAPFKNELIEAKIIF